jgi:hypothetical protein
MAVNLKAPLALDAALLSVQALLANTARPAPARLIESERRACER